MYLLSIFLVTFALCALVALPWLVSGMWGSKGVGALTVVLLLISAAVWLGMPEESLLIPGIGAISVGALFTGLGLLLLACWFAASKVGAFKSWAGD